MSFLAPGPTPLQPDAWLASVGALLSAAADIDAADARALPTPASAAACYRALSDHPLSVCFSFLDSRQRFCASARVCRQWSRVVALPTSNAECVVRLQRPLADTVQPSQTLLRWASQRVAGVSSSLNGFSLLPSPPSVPFGPGTAYPHATSSINCLIGAHLGGIASLGSVSPLNPAAAGAAGPNPPFLSEHLGWPHFARASRDAAFSGFLSGSDLQRRASFEAWCRVSPTHLESLTLRSPFSAPIMLRDPLVLGGGDGEWIDLMHSVAPVWAEAASAVAAPSDVGKRRPDGMPSQRAAAYSAAAASAKAATFQFDPAKSPFPRLRSLTINGSGLSWPVVQAFLRACPSIRHLSVPTDASSECMAACALIHARGSDATVNGLRLSESRCTLCGEHAAPLLTCENVSCNLSGCGPCLLSTRDRRHFLCQSGRRHADGPLLYCYARGPCDNHVCFQCPWCVSNGGGDTSPAQCGACGGLACSEHTAFGSCDHYPRVMHRCSRCRCRKCKYCCGEFDSDDDGGGGGGQDGDDSDDEAGPRKVTHWRHGYVQQSEYKMARR